MLCPFKPARAVSHQSGRCQRLGPPPARTSRLTARAASAAASAPAAEATLLKASRDTGAPRPAPEEVEAALLAVEQASSQLKGYSNVPGRWRLVFSTASSMRQLQYIPLREDFTVNVDTKYVSLEADIGPFAFLTKGTVFAWDPETGTLEFQFDKGVDVRFFGTKIYSTVPNTKRKTYKFFLANDQIACARSSQGGLSLLAK